jgi:mannose-6-phosphate isomerase
MSDGSLKSYPMKVVPRYLPKPWGGRRIGEVLGRILPADKPIGESWELYDRPEGSSEIENGPLAGRRIAELRGGRPLPLLTKVIDARQTLSVQVHPDDDAAIELDGESKTEAWFILQSDPGALIYKGLKDNVGAPQLLKAIREGTVEDCLHSFHPEPGDVVYLPAGTVHAIGGGIVLFEVQENSDTTYRLYDWDRPGLDGEPRDLHIDEAIRSIDFSGRGLDRVEPRIVEDDGRYRRAHRVSCPHFTMEEQEFMGLVTFETERDGQEQWHVVLILDGEGTIRPFGRNRVEAFFAPGDTLILPAENDCYEVEPRPGRTVRLLTVYGS